MHFKEPLRKCQQTSSGLKGQLNTETRQKWAQNITKHCRQDSTTHTAVAGFWVED